MIDRRMEDQDAVSRCEFCGNQYGDDRCGCDAAKDAEITTLRAQLEDARAKAIEECAQVATNFAEVTARLDGGIKSTAAAGMFKLAASIRALLHGSTK